MDASKGKRSFPRNIHKKGQDGRGAAKNNMQARRYINNLPPEERTALRHLRQRTDIIIKPADKGSAVVVLSKEDYIREADRQLNNPTHYCQLTADPTSQYSTEIKAFVDSMFHRGLIDKKTRKFLTPYQPRAARFYLLP